MTLGPLMIDVEGLALTDADKKLLRHPVVGGVILFSRNFHSMEQLSELTAEIHKCRRPPLLIAVDQEGGRVQRFGSPFSRLPAAARLGAQYDVDEDRALVLAQLSGWLMASELRASGVDMSFAPVADLERGRCSVIGDRACHSDPEVVVKLAGAIMTGMHAGGMAATAKHFPGHGAVSQDSHLTLPIDSRNRGLLRQDWQPYQSLIASGLDAVMMALVAYPAVDEQPASFSARWITDLLRRQLGFRGAVFSDDLCMGGAQSAGSMTQRVRAAQQAGCDMMLICNDRDAALSVLERIKTDNPASQARLASLHGRRCRNWVELQRSEQWKRAVKALETLPE